MLRFWITASLLLMAIFAGIGLAISQCYIVSGRKSRYRLESQAVSAGLVKKSGSKGRPDLRMP